MSSFFTAIKQTFGFGAQQQTAHDQEPEAVHIPVEEVEDSKAAGRLSGLRAPDGKEFYVHEGSTVSTVRGLADALNKAPESVFHHHITKQKNDFARWIREVFDDEAAASVLESARNPSEVVYILDTLS